MRFIINIILFPFWVVKVILGLAFGIVILLFRIIFGVCFRESSVDELVGDSSEYIVKVFSWFA